MCCRCGFTDTPTQERQDLFIKKLKLCSRLPDFAEGNNHDKEVKRLNLLEIMDYINQTKGVFNEQTFPDITKMVRAARGGAHCEVEVSVCVCLCVFVCVWKK